MFQNLSIGISSSLVFSLYHMVPTHPEYGLQVVEIKDTKMQYLHNLVFHNNQSIMTIHFLLTNLPIWAFIQNQKQSLTF